MAVPDVVVADMETLRSALADFVRETMVKHVPQAISEASKPEWLHRDAVKEQYGLTDRQLQYLRDHNRVTYSQHGRRIWYHRASLEAYFEEGRVDASQQANPTTR